MNEKQTGEFLTEQYACSFPHMYYIETGNVCNLRCPFCKTGTKTAGLSKGMLSLADFKIMFKKIRPYAKKIVLYNWGEPFLNKNILSMIEICHNAGILTYIHSNLVLREFTETEADAIVRSGLTQLTASIDGASQESYGRYRIGGRFDVAVRNLQMLQLAKEKNNSSTPKLIWKFLVNAFNEHEQDLARTMADQINVNILFQPMNVENEEEWKSEKYHKKRTIEKQNNNRTIPLQPNIPPTLHFPISLSELKLHPAIARCCIQPFTAMVIHWDGSVFPCCAVHGNHYRLGNLLEQNLDQAWNGAPLKSCRKLIINFVPKQNSFSINSVKPCNVINKFSTPNTN